MRETVKYDIRVRSHTNPEEWWETRALIYDNTNLDKTLAAINGAKKKFPDRIFRIFKITTTEEAILEK